MNQQGNESNNMDWKTVVTDKGLAVLAGLDDYHVIEVEAVAGTGVVPVNELEDQKELMEFKQNLHIAEDSKNGNKRVLRLQVRNDTLTENYTLNQLGIIIKVKNKSPVLYFLAQNIEGDVIPSKDKVPGFVAEYIITLEFSTRTAVLTNQATAFVTHDALESKLSEYMKLVPVDGGSFFESYEEFEADGGTFE